MRKEKNVDIKCIDSLLIGNKLALKEQILRFIEENSGGFQYKTIL